MRTRRQRADVACAYRRTLHAMVTAVTYVSVPLRCTSAVCLHGDVI